MIAIDTNMLVRLIVDDQTAMQQVAAARERVSTEDTVSISQCVFIETMWVLERSYGYARAAVCDVAAKLLAHPRYRIADGGLLMLAVDICRSTAVGYADALALAHARTMGATLISFDRKLARLDGAAPV